MNFAENQLNDLLVVVDVQGGLAGQIHNGDEVTRRIEFLIAAATLAEVPTVFTEQVPAKLGPTIESVRAQAPLAGVISKSTFSCMKSAEFAEAWKKQSPARTVLVGMETHICVALTSVDLRSFGASVMVCADAVGARSLERHKLGMERIRDEGAIACHSESVAYEWIGSAAHPRFREFIELVKRYSG